jgi:hypothetical protein
MEITGSFWLDVLLGMGTGAFCILLFITGAYEALGQVLVAILEAMANSSDD